MKAALLVKGDTFKVIQSCDDDELLDTWLVVEVRHKVVNLPSGRDVVVSVDLLASRVGHESVGPVSITIGAWVEVTRV